MFIRRKSKIWSISKDEFELLVKNSDTFTEILRFFGLKNHGNNYKTLRSRIELENVDITHIGLTQAERSTNALRKIRQGTIIPLEEILVEGSTYSRYNLKRRLVKEGLLEYKCSKCKMEPYWNGEELTLILDHINGINDDNRLDNLRFLCPNCNSQTLTFAGRNIRLKNMEQQENRKKTKKTYRCVKCNNEKKHAYSILCPKCLGLKHRKCERPSKEELQELIVKNSFSSIGRMYDVSDNAIRKWCKSYNLEYRKRDINK